MVTAKAKPRDFAHNFVDLCVARGVQLVHMLSGICGAQSGCMEQGRRSLKRLVVNPSSGIRLVGVKPLSHLVAFDVQTGCAHGILGSHSSNRMQCFRAGVESRAARLGGAVGMTC